MAKFLDLEGLNYFWEKIKSWVLERFAYKSDLNQKLDKLRSGQNIKTINNLDILGSGNIEIESGAVDSVNGKIGDVVLDAEDVGALPDSTTIPTKVSDLTNDSGFITTSDIPTNVSDFNNDAGYLTSFTETDPTVPSWAKQPNKPSYDYSEICNTPDLSGFITKNVNDLTNYYLKSETYTKDEVAALIGAIQQFHYEIYATLPASGESNVLYLIGPTGSGADKYEEYVYSNNDFTKIGDTSIDLSGYVTTSALNTALAGYVSSSDLATALSEYTKTSQLATVATSGSYNDLEDKPTIPTVPVQDVTVGGTSIVSNGTAVIPQEVFWATHGVTTFNEVLSAYNAGKICVVVVNSQFVEILSIVQSSSITFACQIGSYLYRCVLSSDDTWSANSVYENELVFNRVSTISGNETNTTKYPNTKATYDAIHPAYGSSQPQDGMLPNVLYKLGTLSGSVTIAFATPSDNTIENEYKFTFTADSTAPTITWPQSVTSWIGNSIDNGAPKVEADTYYEVSVLDGYGIFNKF